MLGERFATVEGDDNSIFRFIEEITKEIEQLAKQHAENEGNTEKQEEIEEKKLVLKMRLILLRLDQQLLNQSIAQITKYVYYNIDSTYPHPTHPLFFFTQTDILYRHSLHYLNMYWYIMQSLFFFKLNTKICRLRGIIWSFSSIFSNLLILLALKATGKTSSAKLQLFST